MIICFGTTTCYWEFCFGTTTCYWEIFHSAFSIYLDLHSSGFFLDKSLSYSRHSWTALLVLFVSLLAALEQPFDVRPVRLAACSIMPMQRDCGPRATRDQCYATPGTWCYSASPPQWSRKSWSYSAILLTTARQTSFAESIGSPAYA
jgi:hypothetical protein